MGVVRRIAVGIFLSIVAAGPVLCQDWAFGEPEKMPSAINTAAEESMPMLAPDGKTLYFTRLMYEQNVGGPYAGQDVWVAKWDGTKWGKAENKFEAFRNTRDNHAVVGISADGNTIYFMNASPNQKIKGIYFTKRINGRWTDPELIQIEGISSEGFIGFYVSPDFQVILISMKGEDSKGEEDLYVSVKNGSGQWSRPKNLGSTINTPGFEISPFLSPDKNRIYFSSNGHGGLGDADVFYCERLYDSWELWSAPKNLGDKVNSKGFDAGFSVSGDTVAFVASNRGGGSADIYRLSITQGRSGPTPESIEKLIEEAKSILSDIKSSDNKATVIFDENSHVLTDAATSTLRTVIENASKSTKRVQFEIQGFYSDQKDIAPKEGLVQKRIERIRNFLVTNGVKTESILVNHKEIPGGGPSPRYVMVIATER
jgi:Tol biopolymer transport system component